jgi:Flp pilus assembly protein TadG
MTNRLLHLGRDERGASLIELALVAPFLATLTIGVVDIAGGYSAKLQLEQAAQRTIERAMQAEKNEINGLNVDFYDSLKAEAAEAADVDDSAVTVKYWLECNGVNQNTSPSTMDADYGKVCTGGQAYARYLSVKIVKNYTPMFQVDWIKGANADGTFTLEGEAAMRVQ